MSDPDKFTVIVTNGDEVARTVEVPIAPKTAEDLLAEARSHFDPATGTWALIAGRGI